MKDDVEELQDEINALKLRATNSEDLIEEHLKKISDLEDELNELDHKVIIMGNMVNILSFTLRRPPDGPGGVISS